MQVADDTERGLLLRVVDNDRVLSGHGIYDSVLELEHRAVEIIALRGNHRRGSLFLVLGLDVQINVFGRFGFGMLPQLVQDRRAFDGQGRFFQPWQMGHGRSIESSSSVYIDGVCGFFCFLITVAMR